MRSTILRLFKSLPKHVTTVILLLIASLCAHGQSTFFFRFEDAQTGIRVIPERVVLTSRNGEKNGYILAGKQITDSGTTKLSVADGIYDIEVTAGGYKTMTTWFEMQGKELKVRFKLDSKQPDRRLAPDYLNKYRGKDIMIITGTLTDEETGLPLAGVKVTTTDKIATTTTDSMGHYLLQLPLAQNESELGKRGTLIFTKDGYTTEIKERFDMWPHGDLILPITMHKGIGTNRTNVIEKREIHRELYKP